MILVKPSHWDSTKPIECDLQHIQLNQDLSYQALSYEWGPPNAHHNDATFPMDDTTILLNGSVITVRRNLFHALSHLRHSLGDQPIWIDALSINQSDTPERNQQVKLMGSIYGGATQVLIWPGRTEDLDERAEALLNRQDDGYQNLTEAITETSLVSTLVEELCGRTYWKRVWIQQEVFLAKSLRIMYGRRHLMPYETFDYLTGLMMREESVSEKIEGSAASALALRKRISSQQSPLGTWLRMACKNDLQTSEPRDLIYDMLGISFDCQLGGLEPDYDKPLLDVYLETISFCRLIRRWPDDERFQKMLAEKLGLSWGQISTTRCRKT